MDGESPSSTMGPNIATAAMSASWESSRLRPRRSPAGEMPSPKSPLASPRASSANTPSPRLYLPVPESAARELRRQASAHVDLQRLLHFLENAPCDWEPGTAMRRFKLFGESITCVCWQRQFFITGTDVVRALIWRFRLTHQPIENRKKFEEGVFSDLRNLKPGAGAVLEEARSKFLDMLYKHNCIRTHKKQKVFVWDAVPHDRLYIDSLRREQQRQGLPVAEDDTQLVASVRVGGKAASPAAAAMDEDVVYRAVTPDPATPRKRPLSASPPAHSPPTKRLSPAPAAVGALARTLSDSSSIDLLVTAVEVAESARDHGVSPRTGYRHHAVAHALHCVLSGKGSIAEVAVSGTVQMVHALNQADPTADDHDDDDGFYLEELGSDEIVEDTDAEDDDHDHDGEGLSWEEEEHDLDDEREHESDSHMEAAPAAPAAPSTAWEPPRARSAPNTPCAASGGDGATSPGRPTTPRPVVPPC